MGWCSGTGFFDPVCRLILDLEVGDIIKKKMIKGLIEALEDQDWDCQSESEYWHNPLVREVMN